MKMILKIKRLGQWGDFRALARVDGKKWQQIKDKPKRLFEMCPKFLMKPKASDRMIENG